MFKQASKQDFEGGHQAYVYEGFLTKLFKDELLSVPYYSHVTQALKGMDCVRQLRRGGGSSPSSWLMVQKPTRELFDNYTSNSRTSPSGQRPNPRVEALEQRINDLQQQLNRLYEFTGCPRG